MAKKVNLSLGRGEKSRTGGLTAKKAIVRVKCTVCGKKIHKQRDSLRRWSGLCRPCATKKSISEGALILDSSRTHGETKTRLYSVWQGMLKRCLKAGRSDEHIYYARGIRPCSDWYKYENFRDWANASGYAEGLQLDRIDNNSGYSPDNCRFVTPREQARNKRSAYERGYGVKLTAQDVDYILNNWVPGQSKKWLAHKFKVSLGTLYHINQGRA